MTDLFAPVRLPLPVFQDLVRQVDRAVADGQIMLVLHEDLPYRELSVLGESPPQVDGMPPSDVAAVIENLDQLLLFAFEYAPDNVVVRWATSRDESLGEEARNRVDFLRNNMPNLRNLWESKSGSVLPPLTSFAYDTVYDAKGVGTAVAIYMSAARINQVGTPDMSDAIRLRMQLWPADVNMLIRELEHVRDTHFQSDLSGGDQENDRPGAAEAHDADEASQDALSES